jgi:fumarate hydratase subunit beta
VRRLVVEDFPVVVVNDLYGGDLYREGWERWRRPVSRGSGSTGKAPKDLRKS